MCASYLGSTFCSSKTEYDLDSQNYLDHSIELLYELASADKKRTSLDLDQKELPLCIFRQGLSGLQAIVKYLKEEENLSYAQIGRLLARDQRTIWTEYSLVADTKTFSKTELLKETQFISTKIVAQRNLSVLEAISIYLKTRQHTNTQIGLLLSKSSKTIWTVLNRAQTKLGITNIVEGRTK